ncbi:MAG: hypothetical protein NTU58_01470 [Candidatus Nealsonbacteria bacterium]|nr:hypothetical protein [Candidatus Nealsonbacteria bacterium]
MKIKYECEVCGLQSDNKEEIEKHEAQGRPATKFSPKEKVEFLRRGLNEEMIWAKGIILRIDFMKNHLYTYTVVTDHEEKLISHDMNLYRMFPEQRGYEEHQSTAAQIMVFEENIRPRGV